MKWMGKCDFINSKVRSAGMRYIALGIVHFQSAPALGAIHYSLDHLGVILIHASGTH